MQYFDSGQVKTEEETKKLIDSFVDRWEKGDLLSPLTIWNEKNQFVGFINLRHEFCKQPGHVELGYMIVEEQWNKGYAQEAVREVMNFYLDDLVKKGYKIGNFNLSAVVATAHPDNPASYKILSNYFDHFLFKKPCIGYRENHPRLFYYKPLNVSINEMEFYRPDELFVGATLRPVDPSPIKLRSKL